MLYDVTAMDEHLLTDGRQGLDIYTKIRGPCADSKVKCWPGCNALNDYEGACLPRATSGIISDAAERRAPRGLCARVAQPAMLIDRTLTARSFRGSWAAH